MVDNKYIIIYSAIIPLVSTTLAVIKSIREFIKESRSEIRPLFFVDEVLLNSFSNEQKHYKLKGRLVSKKKVEFSSMSFELPDYAEWKGDPKCCYCGKGGKGDEITLTKKERNSNIVILEGVVKDAEKNFSIGNDYSYEIEGEFVTNEEKRIKEAETLDVKALTVTLSGVKGYKENKIDNLKVIKCPNIKNRWLGFYLVFSMIIVFLGFSSTWICIINNWGFILDAKWYLTFLKLCYFGLLPLLFIGYFAWVNMKCVSQFIVLIRMTKFGIQAKSNSKIISNKTLIPKTIEYMTGTEIVDNINNIL